MSLFNTVVNVVWISAASLIGLYIVIFLVAGSSIYIESLFKKKEEPKVDPVLKSASQLKKDLEEQRLLEQEANKKLVEHYKEGTLFSIATEFNKNNHPWKAYNQSSDIDNMNLAVDALKPELEAAGYEVVSIIIDENYYFSSKDIGKESREVRIREEIKS